MLQDKAATRHTVLVRNRPGELMKLTKFLLDAGMTVDELRVANLGSRASIQFSTRRECVLPPRLRRARIA